jgi:hypothetical protein
MDTLRNGEYDSLKRDVISEPITGQQENVIKTPRARHAAKSGLEQEVSSILLELQQ